MQTTVASHCRWISPYVLDWTFVVSTYVMGDICLHGFLPESLSISSLFLPEGLGVRGRWESLSRRKPWRQTSPMCKWLHKCMKSLLLTSCFHLALLMQVYVSALIPLVLLTSLCNLWICVDAVTGNVNVRVNFPHRRTWLFVLLATLSKELGWFLSPGSFTGVGIHQLTTAHSHFAHAL